MASKRLSEPVEIGRRIVVWGVTGSGKTIVARRLGEALGLPVLELDSLFWRPVWQRTPPAEFRLEVAQKLVADGAWISDGDYFPELGALALTLADTVVWVRLPWYVSFWRLLKRTVQRAWRRQEPWADGGEAWRSPLLSKDTIRWVRASIWIVWWSIWHHTAHARDVHRLLMSATQNAVILELRSQREVEAFLRAVEQVRSAPP